MYPARSILKGVALAAIAALMWVLLSFVLKKAFSFSSPETLSWFRLSSSALAMGLFFLTKRESPFKYLKKIHWLMLPASLGLAFNYVGYAIGLDYTTPGNAQMLIQMGPFLITLFTFLLGREKPTRWQLAGFTLASIGFLLFYQGQIQFFILSLKQYQLGNLWIVGASIAWAFWAFIQRDEAKKGIPVSHLNFLVWTLCAFILLPWAKPQELIALNVDQYAILAFLGLNTLIAYGCYTLAYQFAPTFIVNLIIATNPLLVFWLGGEPLSTLAWMGILLVFSGLGLSLLRSSKKCIAPK